MAEDPPTHSLQKEHAMDNVYTLIGTDLEASDARRELGPVGTLELLDSTLKSLLGQWESYRLGGPDDGSENTERLMARAMRNTNNTAGIGTVQLHQLTTTASDVGIRCLKIVQAGAVRRCRDVGRYYTEHPALEKLDRIPKQPSSGLYGGVVGTRGGLERPVVTPAAPASGTPIRELGASAVGAIVTWEDLEAWMSKTGACDSGVAEVLDAAGIGHNYDDDVECDGCGAEYENAEPTLTWCSTFTICEEMLEAADAADYGDQVRSWANGRDTDEGDWGFLDSTTLPAGPSAPGLTGFTPALGLMAGLVEYAEKLNTDTDDVLTISGKLGALAQKYANRKELPPVPGTAEIRGRLYFWDCTVLLQSTPSTQWTALTFDPETGAWGCMDNTIQVSVPVGGRAILRIEAGSVAENPDTDPLALDLKVSSSQITL